MGNSFRDNLRSELKFQDITIKELSYRTGIPTSTLDCYLGTRATNPSVDAALKIAKTLKVSVEYLVIGEEVIPSPNLKKKLSQEARYLIKWIEGLNQEQCKVILEMISVFRNQT